jgi:hypothetical protein
MPETSRWKLELYLSRELELIQWTVVSLKDGEPLQLVVASAGPFDVPEEVVTFVLDLLGAVADSP